MERLRSIKNKTFVIAASVVGTFLFMYQIKLLYDDHQSFLSRLPKVVQCKDHLGMIVGLDDNHDGEIDRIQHWRYQEYSPNKQPSQFQHYLSGVLEK